MKKEENENLLQKGIESVVNNIDKQTQTIKSEIEEYAEDENYLENSADIVNNIPIDEVVQLRKNPESLVNENQAKNLENILKTEGFIPWLEKRLNTMFIGNKKNIYRKLLACFNIARGYDSCFSSSTGDSQSGKTYEDKMVLKYLIPALYVIFMNAPTYAAFTRDGLAHEEYYNRSILSVGDIGHKSDLEEFLPIARVYKNLITEHKYSRKVTASGNKGTIKLNLTVESCGCFYATTTTIEEIDKQMESRALKSTPYPMDEKKIRMFNDLLRVSFSKESKAKEEAIVELALFRNYFLWKVCDDTEIVNPWGSVFDRYVKNTSATIREHDQINNLFDGYCKLTSYDCEVTENGVLVASKKQLMEFLKYVALENAMQPNTYNFLKMLINGPPKSKDYDVTLIDEDPDEYGLMDRTYYINHVLEHMGKNDLYTYDEYNDSYNNLESLNDIDTKTFYKILISNYGIDRHTGGVFFNTTSISNAFRSNKPYRDLIGDVSQVLYNLYLDGFLGKWDTLYNGKTIYYLTTKCEDLSKPIKISKEDVAYRNEFLNRLNLRIILQ